VDRSFLLTLDHLLILVEQVESLAPDYPTVLDELIFVEGHLLLKSGKLLFQQLLRLAKLLLPFLGKHMRPDRSDVHHSSLIDGFDKHGQKLSQNLPIECLAVDLFDGTLLEHFVF